MVDYNEERDTRLSPTEFYYYKRYLKHPDSKALLITKEVHFHELELLTEEVVEIFKLIIALHPIAHTGFEAVIEERSKDKVVRRKILDITDALDCHVILNLKDKAMLNSPTIRTFNLEKQGPVKFAFSIKPYLIVRFIFHRVGFDYRGVEVFIDDFKLLLKRLGTSVRIPKLTCTHSRQTFHDFDRYLTSNFHPLAKFWAKKMKKGITKTSFSNTIRTISLRRHAEDFHYSYLSFTPSTSRNIKQMALRYNISLFSLVVSVYQLMLSFYSNKEHVTILTELDLRKKITGADNLIESMTNLVPLTTKIPIKKDQELVIFLPENDSAINEFLSMAAFPFSDICENLKSADCKYILRHKVVERLLKMKTDNVISEGKTRDLGMIHETSLEFVYDKERNILNLQLQASSDAYSENDAIGILENMAKILRLISSKPEVSINQLRLYILENKTSLDLCDLFIKMGENGENEDVLMTLSDNNDGHNTVLSWSYTSSKIVNFINPKTVSNVHLITVSDSKGLWMKTSNAEEYRFIFKNKDHIKEWIERLESILNFKIVIL